MSIDEIMSEEALLEQLLEECGELVQAGAKRLRILRGESPTPVTEVQNLRGLTEELGDVSLCIGVLCDKLHIREDVHGVAKAKEERWEQRLIKKATTEKNKEFWETVGNIFTRGY